jgi:acyl-CoA thioesterase FadM
VCCGTGRWPAPAAVGEPGAGPASIRFVRRLEWSDTDRSGHWHHTAAFRLTEAAESALLEKLGLLGALYDEAGFTMPRVHLEADFRRPVHYRDTVVTELAVAEVGRTSAALTAAISADGTTCAVVRAVIVLRDGSGRPVEWPDEWRRLLLT